MRSQNLKQACCEGPMSDGVNTIAIVGECGSGTMAGQWLLLSALTSADADFLPALVAASRPSFYMA
jgi:hypothetical protein